MKRINYEVRQSMRGRVKTFLNMNMVHENTELRVIVTIMTVNNESRSVGLRNKAPGITLVTDSHEIVIQSSGRPGANTSFYRL